MWVYIYIFFVLSVFFYTPFAPYLVYTIFRRRQGFHSDGEGGMTGCTLCDFFTTGRRFFRMIAKFKECPEQVKKELFLRCYHISPVKH